jgi:hypothetical protein
MIKDLIGKTLVKIVGEKNCTTIELLCDNGERYVLYHDWGYCECEGVIVEDIYGDIDNLKGSPILIAEQSTIKNNPLAVKFETKHPHTSIDTFHRIATINGEVVIRWYGPLNGVTEGSFDFVRLFF